MTFTPLGLPLTTWAMGVGNPTSLSALGEPLRLRFPVRLTPREALTADCVRVEVWVGDSQVPPQLLQLQPVGTGDAAVQALLVQVAMPMQEPIVGITLKLGCLVSLIRQYISFIDSPKAPTAPAVSALLPAWSQVELAAVPLALPQYSTRWPANLPDANGRSAPLQPPAVSAGAAAVKETLPGNEGKVVNKPPRNAPPTNREAKTSASAGPKLRWEIPVASSSLLRPVLLLDGVNMPDPSWRRLQQMEAALALLRQGNGRIEVQLLMLKSQRAVLQQNRPFDSLVVVLGLVLASLAGVGYYIWQCRKMRLAVDDVFSWRINARGDEPVHSNMTLRPTAADAAAADPGNPFFDGVGEPAVKLRMRVTPMVKAADSSGDSRVRPSG